MRRLLIAILLLFSDPLYAAFGIFQVNGPSPATGWHTLAVGAGGTSRHLSVATDGTLLLPTDTYGMYAKLPGGTHWYQLMTRTSMPAGTFDIKTNAAGIYDASVCSGNSNIAYMVAADGNAYKTSNLQSAASGVTWTKLAGFTTITAGTAQNTWGPLVACDPANTSGNIAVIGTQTTGAFYTTDGGTTWTKVSTVANGTSHGVAVAFDPHSTVTGSGSTAATQGVAFLTYGTGVYYGSAGPSGAFSLLNTAGMPTTFGRLKVDVLGRIWVAADSGGNNISVCTAASCSWSNLAIGTWATVAVDPNACAASGTCHVAYISSFGALTYSITGGLTAGSLNSVWPSTTISGDTGWLNQSTPFDSGSSFTIGDAIFDTATSGRLNIAGGQFDFMTTPVPTASTSSVAYTVTALGVEQLDAQVVLAPKGTSNILIGALDLPVWYKSSGSLDTNATTYIPSYGNQSSIVVGWSADWCGPTPSTLVMIMEGGFGTNQWSGKSTDGGQTWTKFGTVPAFAASTWGGSIACSTTSAMVWVPRGATKPSFTTDGGATWSTSTTSFSGVLGPTGNEGVQALIVEADKTTTNVFYMFQSVNSGAGGGLFKSTDGGNNWTLQAADPDSAHSASSMTLKCSYLTSGECFYTSGWQSVPGMSTSEQFWKTTGGAFSLVPGLCSVHSFNFGAQVSGQSYASITAVGFYNAADTSSVCAPGSFTYTFGIWQSMNDGVSFTQIGPYPLGNVNWIPALDCDKVIQGECYIATFGSGSMYYTPYLLKRDLDPAANDNSPAFLVAVG